MIGKILENMIALPLSRAKDEVTAVPAPFLVSGLQ